LSVYAMKFLQALSLFTMFKKRGLPAPAMAWVMDFALKYFRG